MEKKSSNNVNNISDLVSASQAMNAEWKAHLPKIEAEWLGAVGEKKETLGVQVRLVTKAIRVNNAIIEKGLIALSTEDETECLETSVKVVIAFSKLAKAANEIMEVFEKVGNPFE